MAMGAPHVVGSRMHNACAKKDKGSHHVVWAPCYVGPTLRGHHVYCDNTNKSGLTCHWQQPAWHAMLGARVMIEPTVKNIIKARIEYQAPR